MRNIIHVYHLRDAYDHSLGYATSNTYTNLSEDTIKELIAKHERYVKGGDLGGYWLQVINYEVGGAYTIEDHTKVAKQKHRIELNIKAKYPKLSTDKLVKQNVYNVPVNNFWQDVADAGMPVPEEAPPQGEWV